MASARGVRVTIAATDRHGFEVEAVCDRDSDWDFSHYGRFCEERDARPGEVLVRNPSAWRHVEDAGRGRRVEAGEEWCRVDRGTAGWFAVPKEVFEGELEAICRKANLSLLDPPEEARLAAEQWARDIAYNIAHEKLYAIWIRVTVRHRDRAVGEASLGGIEVIGEAGGDAGIERLARECGLVEEALEDARRTLEKEAQESVRTDSVPESATPSPEGDEGGR